MHTVLFDLYDTLVWSDWSSHAAMLATRLAVAQEAVTDAYELLRHDRDGGHHGDAKSVLRAVVETCNVEADPRLIEELVVLEAELLAEQVRWYDDSLAVLRRLRAAGLKTGVVSKCSPSTRPVVDRLGLEAETGVVVLSCEVGEAKPSAGIFRAALASLDASPQGAVFVDDRADYLDGAAEVGMTTFRIARPTAFGEDVANGNHPVVADLTELEHRLLRR